MTAASVQLKEFVELEEAETVDDAQWSDNTILQYTPFHELQKVQTVLTKRQYHCTLLPTCAYRWLPLDPSQRQHPFLHRGAASYRLPLLLVGKTLLREDHLLGLTVGGQIKKEEVKEGREDGGLVAVSDQNDRRRVILGMSSE